MKDHFPLPFFDQMLEHLASKSHYYFLDGFFITFSDFLENIIEVFMDDFTVYGSSFNACVDNLTRVLNRCV